MKLHHIVLSAVLQLALSASAYGETANQIVVRGIVRAVQQAMISTELQARAMKIDFNEGDTFKKGEVLVEFDCRRQNAALASAEAQQLETSLAYDNAQFLQKVQAAGKHEIETAKARLAKTTADADGLRAQLDDCLIEAPFDGRILQLGLKPFETPVAGRPFIGIISDARLEIDLIVASGWADWLKVGTQFKFRIDETQSEFAVTVIRVGAAVDPISQTLKIAAIFSEPTSNILPGMSGSASFVIPGGESDGR